MFKSKGFSLMEILIALGLVGILVAVLSPNLAKMLPDKKKAMFIKAYTRTEIAVANMRNHSEMYVDLYDPDNGSFKRYGLSNTEAPSGMLAANANSYSGDTKFINYFSQELGGTISGSNVVTNDGITYGVEFSSCGTSRSCTAAEIAVSILDKDKNAENIGNIKILNDATVQCGDDLCKEYMLDRFNMKQDRSKLGKKEE